MTTDTIILIEYESGKSEWRPNTVETLAHIAASFDCIAGVHELEAGATAPADNGADDDDWEGIACRLSMRHDEAIKERDEAIEQLRQARAEKLQAVKVLVGADECCDECRAISENENRRRAGDEE